MLFFCLAVQFFSPPLFNFYFVYVLKMSKRNKDIKQNMITTLKELIDIFSDFEHRLLLN